jgi:hypothetical protein
MRARRVNTRTITAILATAVLAVALAACSSSSKSGSGGGGATGITAPPPSASNPEPYPAPTSPMELAAKAGLVPEDAEQLEYHVHAHLDVFLDGKHLTIPGGIGIDTTNPGVHSGLTDGLPAFGGIVVPCNKACISPLHTHDVTGVLHTESRTHKDNTLGQFFVEWNVRLTSTCFGTYCAPAKTVAVYVDGTKFTGDPTTIPLSDLKEIAIVVGTPPAQIPNTFDQGLI